MTPGGRELTKPRLDTLRALVRLCGDAVDYTVASGGAVCEVLGKPPRIVAPLLRSLGEIRLVHEVAPAVTWSCSLFRVTADGRDLVLQHDRDAFEARKGKKPKGG